MKSILLIKKFLGLVEMTSGLVNASFGLPEWQAVKLIFFAPWNETIFTPEFHFDLHTVIIEKILYMYTENLTVQGSYM